MSSNINLNEAETQALIDRIIVRMGNQSEPELMHVLTRLFPNSGAMRLKSVAEDLAEKRMNAEIEFKNLIESDSVDKNIFKALSSADKGPNMIFSRSSYDPFKFELTLECARTPFKEFFDECKDITCEDCIKGRITNFQTENKNSKKPWKLKVDRVEQARTDLCKGCGKILDPKKDDINMQNERMLYTCSYCGHKGWNKAK